MKLPLWDICQNYHRGNPQSVKANEIAHKYKIPARQRILEALENDVLKVRGLTCEDLEMWTNLSHQTCSARLSDLKHEGKIKVVGVRKTRSGSDAAVYQAL